MKKTNKSRIVSAWPWAMLAAILLAISCVGCSQRRDKDVPRQEAYPRVPELGNEYISIDSLPFALIANKQSKCNVERRSNGTVWVTIDYPQYKSAAYMTFTPLANSNEQDILANRAERMLLDWGESGASPQTQYFTANGYDFSMGTLPSALSTPIKFVGNGDKRIVSGTVFCYGATSVDQAAPIVKALSADIRHILLNLKEK